MAGFEENECGGHPGPLFSKTEIESKNFIPTFVSIKS
jgi:hypothetical protein